MEKETQSSDRSGTLSSEEQCLLTRLIRRFLFTRWREFQTTTPQAREQLMHHLNAEVEPSTMADRFFQHVNAAYTSTVRLFEGDEVYNYNLNELARLVAINHPYDSASNALNQFLEACMNQSEETLMSQISFVVAFTALLGHRLWTTTDHSNDMQLFNRLFDLMMIVQRCIMVNFNRSITYEGGLEHLLLSERGRSLFVPLSLPFDISSKPPLFLVINRNSSPHGNGTELVESSPSSQRRNDVNVGASTSALPEQNTAEHVESDTDELPHVCPFQTETENYPSMWEIWFGFEPPSVSYEDENSVQEQDFQEQEYNILEDDTAEHYNEQPVTDNESPQLDDHCASVAQLNQRHADNVQPEEHVANVAQPVNYEANAAQGDECGINVAQHDDFEIDVSLFPDFWQQTGQEACSVPQFDLLPAELQQQESPQMEIDDQSSTDSLLEFIAPPMEFQEQLANDQPAEVVAQQAEPPLEFEVENQADVLPLVDVIELINAIQSEE